MRIDKVQNKIDCNELQRMVNKLALEGLKQEAILNHLANKIHVKAGINEFSPRIALHKSNIKRLSNSYTVDYLCDCGKKVRHLYFLNNYFACRYCHKLNYQHFSYKEKILRKLLRDPNKLNKYNQSRRNEPFWTLLEAEHILGISQRILLKRGYKLADYLIKNGLAVPITP